MNGQLDGATRINGNETGETVVNISLGIKFRPFHSEHWQVGVGVRVPGTNRQEFKTRSVVSVFYHFH